MTRNLPNNQRGAALVVGMLLLIVLTLLAISGMGTASLELVMAGNNQYQQNAFQTSDSGVEYAWRTGAFSAAVPAVATNQIITISSTDSVAISTLCQTNCAILEFEPPPDTAFSANEFGSLHYETTSTGTSARGGSGQVVLGFMEIVKKSDAVAPVGVPPGGSGEILAQPTP